MALMDFDIALRPIGFHKIRGGRFEDKLIHCFDHPTRSTYIIPLRGKLTEAGLFKVREIKEEGKETVYKLAVTAACVEYLLGGNEKVGAFQRKDIDKLVAEASDAENKLLDRLHRKMTAIYQGVISQLEEDKSTPGQETQKPSGEEMNDAIQFTAKKFHLNSNIVDRTLEELGLLLKIK